MRDEDLMALESDGNFVMSFARGLAVLRAFGSDRPEMTLSETAAATGLNPAVARRCLHTLVELGYVAKHERRFFLCPKVFEFSIAYTESTRLDAVARDPLANLRDITGDSTTFSILVGQDAITLLLVPTLRMVSPAMHIGTRSPGHETASGCVLLAHQSEEVIDRYVASLAANGAKTGSAALAKGLKQRLRAIRADGYATSLNDATDWFAVAVPIMGPSGNIVAAICCIVTEGPEKGAKLTEERLPHLRKTAGEIELGLKLLPILARSLGDK
jgi:IclR family pca regulon transcriptional regulator